MINCAHCGKSIERPGLCMKCALAEQRKTDSAMTDPARKAAEEIMHRLNLNLDNTETVTAAVAAIISAHLPAPQPVEAMFAPSLNTETRTLGIQVLGSAEQYLLNGDDWSKSRARDLIIGFRRHLEKSETAQSALARENESLRLALNLVAEYLEDEPIWNAIVPTGKPDTRDEMQTLGHVIEAALSRLTTPAGGA